MRRADCVNVSRLPAWVLLVAAVIAPAVGNAQAPDVRQSATNDPQLLYPSGTEVLDLGDIGAELPPAVPENATKPAVVDLLGEALANEHDVHRRTSLVQELGHTRLSQAIPAVERALHDDKALVRVEAAASLGEIGKEAGNRQIAEALLNRLREEKDLAVRLQIIEAGGKLRDGRLVEAGLADSDPRLVTAAIRAATPAQADALAGLLPSLSPAQQQAAIESLGRFGGDHGDAVASLLAGSPDVPRKLAVLKALGQMRAKALLPAVKPLLADGHPTVRRVALEALAGMAEPEFRRQQAAFMLGDPDAAVRAAAAQVLVELPLPGARDALLELLPDPSRPVHRLAREALVSIGRDTVEPAAALLTDVDPRRREDGSYILGRLGSDASFEKHVALLEDDDWDVVRQAADSLRLIGRAEAGPALLQALIRINRHGQSAHTGDALSAILHAGGTFRYPPFSQPAKAMIRQGHPKVVAAAIWTYGVLHLDDPSDQEVCGLLMAYVVTVFTPEPVLYESLKALGHMRYRPALAHGESAFWTNGSEGDYILGWMRDRFEGTRTPYVPRKRGWQVQPSVTPLE